MTAPAFQPNPLLSTPFGVRPLVYFDYSATARPAPDIEEKLTALLPYYGNTHSHTSSVAKIMRHYIERSYEIIKTSCNADAQTIVLLCGNGATHAIKKFQEIAGIAMSPSLKQAIDREVSVAELFKPIVYISNFEHHSNEHAWHEGFCEVVRVPCTLDLCGIDLDFLKEHLSRQPLRREKIVFFSAASNVTGLRLDIPAVTALSHSLGALCCFDISADIAYNPLDFTKFGDHVPDGLVFSSHKLEGGNGGHGVLLIQKNVYQKFLGDLPPSNPGGGTIRFSYNDAVLYHEDFQTREGAGTPDPVAIYKTALSIEKNRNHNRSSSAHSYFSRFLTRYQNDPRMVFYGPSNTSLRNPVAVCNFTSGDTLYHPDYIATLYNDLFGIQVRSGCFCASTYVHMLLAQQCSPADMYSLISTTSLHGFKKGMIRISFSHSTTDIEFEYLLEATDFLLSHAAELLKVYAFGLQCGSWTCSQDFLSKFNLKHTPQGFDALNIESIFSANTQFLQLIKNIAVKKDCIPNHLHRFTYFPYMKISDEKK